MPVVSWLLRAAERTPGAVAIVCPRAGRVTYEQLAARSNALALALTATGAGRHDRVMLVLDRSADAIIAMLAALRAGCCYVPVYERAPRGKYEQLVALCQPAAIVCDPARAATLAGMAAGRVIAIGGDDEPLADNASDHMVRCIDQDLAYIMFTSGSSGVPKGVMITRAAVADYAAWATSTLDITPDDTILCTSRLFSDMSVFDIYGALHAGATLAIATEEHLKWPPALQRFIEEQKVTIWKGVASLLANMARFHSLDPARMPTLTRVLFSGERMPLKYLRAWMRTYPNKRFYNAYGPTEATGVSMYYEIPRCPADEDDDIPIGKGRTNVDAIIADDSGRRVATGELGEIWLRGTSLSPGYWGAPEQTANRFVTRTNDAGLVERFYRTGDLGIEGADGNIGFRGRADDQVKFHGYRIELGEIDRALLSLDEVVDAASFVAEDQAKELPALIATIVLRPGARKADVATRVRELLPAHMVPTRIVELPTLPRTANGKLDRNAVRDMIVAASVSAPPR